MERGIGWVRRNLEHDIQKRGCFPEEESSSVLITERSGMKWNVKAICDLEQSSSKGGRRSQIRRAGELKQVEAVCTDNSDENVCCELEWNDRA